MGIFFKKFTKGVLMYTKEHSPLSSQFSCLERGSGSLTIFHSLQIKANFFLCGLAFILENSDSVSNLSAAAAAKLLQSCPTLCDPIDGSPPSPAVPGILQARTLEWVAISSSYA